MILAIVLITLLLLGLWSGSLYLVYLVVESAAALPWVEFAARIQAWVPPAWLAAQWENNLHLIVPALKALHPFILSVSGWFALALGILWFAGALVLGLLALIVCVIVIAVRKDDAKHAAVSRSAKSEPS
jgi:hypothetical protein